MILGAYAEFCSYRTAILIGITGRVATRFLLLFGTTLSEMQLMQVTYAMVRLCTLFMNFVYSRYIHTYIHT